MRGGGARGGEAPPESALARPRNGLAYAPESDLADLAAAHRFGLVRNHSHVDGNERVACAGAATFLRLNRVRLGAGEPEAYDAVIGAAEGRCAEEDLAEWIRTHNSPGSG